MDIRNYFSAPNANKKLGKKTTTKKGSSKRRIQDSDDDELGDHKASKTSTSQETSTSKSNTSTPTRQSTRLNRKNTKADEQNLTTKKERERSDTTKSKSDVNKDDDFVTMEVDDETSPPQSTSENPGIFTTPRRSRKTTEVTPKAVTKKRSKKIDDDDDFVLEEESKSHSPPKKTKREQKLVAYKPSSNRAIKTPRSKRQNVDEEDDEEGTSITPNKVQDNSAVITTPIKGEENDSSDIVIDRSNLNKADPTTPESREIPQGEEMCLFGKTFVFTGDLSMDREEAQDLVKRHGGRVTSQPSSKTSYVVVGQDPGPKKMEKVKQLNIKTLNEDQLLELIRTSPKKSQSLHLPHLKPQKLSHNCGQKNIDPKFSEIFVVIKIS